MLREIFDTAKANVRCTGINVPFASRADHIAGAVFTAAKKGTAPVNALDDARFLGVPTADWPLGVLHNLTKFFAVTISVWMVEIIAPFPNVA